MITRRQVQSAVLAAAAVATPITASAQAAAQPPIVLPPPRGEGGQPLTAALKLRRSTRAYSNQALSAQTLSDLLWAAFGVNRPAAIAQPPTGSTSW